MCCTIGHVGDLVVQGKMLRDPVQSQAGFKGVEGVTLDFRIQKIRLWGLSTARPVRLTVYGWNNTALAGGGALAVVEDWPGKVSFPSVGYVLPTAMNQIVLSSDSTDKVFAVDVAKDVPWLAYIDLLWRGNKYSSIEDHPRARLLDLPSTSSSFCRLSEPSE